MVAKGKSMRHRLQKGKAKRWKKGHSSESNPDSKKYREAARNRYFSKPTGSSSLTMAALAIHDKTQDGEDGTAMVDDLDTQTMGTFKTWATNWTDCTNTVFDKVHRYCYSNSAEHKETLAVLAAVTEVIKSKGGVESSTEYFAALMTALESTEEETSLSAIVYLIKLVLRSVPAAVLSKKFSEAAKCFLDLLAKHSDTGSGSFLKSLIVCIGFLLKNQQQTDWKNSSTQHVYRCLLTFLLHKKPRARKAAQSTVCMILKASGFMLQAIPPSHHPAAALTAKHCIETIESSNGVGENTHLLQMLSFLGEILPVLPQNSVKQVCETILKLFTLSNVMVTATGMRAFHSLFSAEASPENLPPGINAKVITALHDFQPSENDVQPISAWLSVMTAAHVNLARLDEKQCMNQLPRFVSAVMVCLLSNKPDVTKTASKSLQTIIKSCLAPMSEMLGAQLQITEIVNPIHKVLKALERGLGYEFHASWGHVLQIFAELYLAVGKEAPEAFYKSLKAIAELRDGVQFRYTGEVDHAVGYAVKAMGPKHVLAAVPLQITGQSDDLDFPHSWLLPVIRDNVQNTELAFFTTYFLPLAVKLRQRSLELSDQQNIVASKTYEALQLQIWSLLPGFCTRPTDLATSFGDVAKVLGSAVSEREDLRMEVMASLRKLINQSLDTEETRKELARFSKNFMPIFFNLYTTDPVRAKDMSKLAILETIKCYFQITDKQAISNYCKICQVKLKEEDLTPYKRLAFYDLLIAMIPYLQSDQLLTVFTLSQENLESLDNSVQKKGYRIMEDICSCKSDDSREFVEQDLTKIQTALIDGLSSSSPPSKAPRLRCLINVIKLMETKQWEFIENVVPEAIWCIKEVATMARKAAFLLLKEMGAACQRWDTKDGSPDLLEEYFKIIMAGLGGSTWMISCTLKALTSTMYMFKDEISSTFIESAIQNVCLLLKSPTREVVASSLSFMKELSVQYPVEILSQHLDTIMASLTSMKEDCHHHFRFKSKEVYAKLIKKFGYEHIYNLAPESIRKQLTNIRKTQEIQKKKKKRRQEDGSEEEEDEEEKFNKQPESIEEMLEDSDSDEDEKKSKQKKHKDGARKKTDAGKAWLHEGGDDDITDFMDISASKKVMASRPIQTGERKKKDSGFKTAPDGRLIITESSDDEGDADSEMEDIDDLLDALEKGRDSGKIKQSRKRKLDDFAGSDDEVTRPNKYKAGGKGIHRPLNKPQKVAAPGSEYKAKKAGGDIKKGKFEPYAYIPMDYNSLNKRKQAKMKGKYSNLVKSAKKGAAVKTKKHKWKNTK